MPTSPRFDLAQAARVLSVALFVAAGGAVAAEPAMRTVTVKVGAHPLKVEVAETDAQREKGLMFRKSMPKNEGMLFIFDEPAYQAMWMKNTLIPLSVAFIDREGVILNIADMEPQTLEGHQAAGPAVYAIETNVGWYAERHLKAGDKVTGLPKAPAAR